MQNLLLKHLLKTASCPTSLRLVSKDKTSAAALKEMLETNKTKRGF